MVFEVNLDVVAKVQLRVFADNAEQAEEIATRAVYLPCSGVTEISAISTSTVAESMAA